MKSAEARGLGRLDPGPETRESKLTLPPATPIFLFLMFLGGSRRSAGLRMQVFSGCQEMCMGGEGAGWGGAEGGGGLGGRAGPVLAEVVPR